MTFSNLDYMTNTIKIITSILFFVLSFFALMYSSLLVSPTILDHWYDISLFKLHMLDGLRAIGAILLLVLIVINWRTNNIETLKKTFWLVGLYLAMLLAIHFYLLSIRIII